MLKNYKIQEICTLEKGKQIDTTCLNDSNPYQYINGGINASGFYGKYNTDENTVIVSEGGASCGYVNYVTEKFWCGCHCYKLINPKVTPKYLYYALKGNQNSIMELRTGAAMPNIKKSSFNDMNIKLDDDKNVQATVISSLDKIQTLIDGKNTQLKSLDELVKSRFIEMFGDVKNNDKNFPTKQGSDLFRFSSGKFLEASKRLENGIPVYGGNGIAWYTSEPLINFATIVIGRVGAYCGNVRKISGSNWVTDNAIYIKEFKEDCFNLEFLEELMCEYNFAQYNDAAAQPKITQKPMETLRYIVPPIELQNTFAEFVKQVDKSKFVVSLA